MAKTWLSQEAYARLQAELDELKTDGRRRMSAMIAEARAHGDIRENAEYHAAKDDQGQMEARIRQLEQLLRDAHVGGSQPTDAVAPGLVVTVEIGGDVETYLLGSREDHHDEYDILSMSSPLGKALLGARPGEVVRADAPAGAYEVLVKDIQSL